MTLKTDNSDITLDSGTANVCINAHTRIENTDYETEINMLGNKFQLTGGASEEIFYGGKFESINALAIAAAVFDWNFLFKLEGSLINILVDDLVIKKRKIGRLKSGGFNCEIVEAAKIIL